MWHHVTGEARPAAFFYDREGLGRPGKGAKKVVTLWWIAAMSSLDFLKFVSRNNDDLSSSDLPTDQRTASIDSRDKDMVAAQIVKIENCWDEGDCISDPVEVRAALDKCDYAQLQDMLKWVRSTAALEAAAK